jgi:hypothetical protein
MEFTISMLCNIIFGLFPGVIFEYNPDRETMTVTIDGTTQQKTTTARVSKSGE